MSQQGRVLYGTTHERAVEENHPVMFGDLLGQTRTEKTGSPGDQNGFVPERRMQ
jgi:hypothetical protein